MIASSHIGHRPCSDAARDQRGPERPSRRPGAHVIMTRPCIKTSLPNDFGILSPRPALASASWRSGLRNATSPGNCLNWLLGKAPWMGRSRPETAGTARPCRWCTETMTEERPHAPDGDRLAGLDRPLRNRVTPAGELIATEHRGTMYGNRGVLHNESLALVRRHQVRRWLACVLEFRGRRRPILRPRRYTELFFLDEAVALAAGHRPCAECRHAAYQSFRTAWTAARALPAKPAADDIDQVLHWQRRLVDGPRHLPGTAQRAARWRLHRPRRRVLAGK